MGNGERINDRQTLSEQAKSLGIDSRGMNATEKRAAITEKTETNKKEEDSRNAMAQFVREQLADDRSRNPPPTPVALPTVNITPVTEATTTQTPTTGRETSSSASDATDSLPLPPEEGKYVLGSIDGVIQWIEAEGCEDDSVSTS
jgi:hypothetical protein